MEFQDSYNVSQAGSNQKSLCLRILPCLRSCCLSFSTVSLSSHPLACSLSLPLTCAVETSLQAHALLAWFSCTRVPPMPKATRPPAWRGETRNFGLACAQQVLTFTGDELWVVLRVCLWYGSLGAPPCCSKKSWQACLLLRV